MATGEPTGAGDFLQKEVGESLTDEARKAETKRLLAEAEEIKARFPENPSIAKEYEDLRNTTILSLQNLQADLRDELLAVRVELDGSGVETLSDGSIDETEFARIEEEFGELKGEEREVQLQKLEKVLTEKGVMGDYDSFVSFLSYPEIQGDLIIKIIDDFQKNGVLKTETLQELETISRNIMEFNNFDAIKNNRAIELLQEVLESGDSSPLENFDNYINPVTRLQALRYIFGEDNTLIGKFLFDFNPKNDFFSDGCSSHVIIFIDYLYANYLESQNIILEQNLNNYFLNANIPQSRIDELKPKIDQLKKTLTQGGCNIDYIGSIVDFNNLYFPDKEMILTSEDAKNIISSTIRFRETDNTLGFIRLRERLNGLLVNKSEKEIQAIFDISDIQKRNDALRTLLDEIKDETIQGQIQTEMIGLFENAEDIARQETTQGEVIVNADKIYKMTPDERDEYRNSILLKYNTVLSNSKKSFGKISSLNSVQIVKILENPKEYLSEITDQNQLLEIFKKYPEELKNTQITLYDINPRLRNNRSVLIEFPVKMSKGELNLISQGVIQDKGVIKSLLENSWDPYIFFLAAQGSEENIGLTYRLIKDFITEGLITLDNIYSDEDIISLSSWSFPDILLDYDKKQKPTEQIFVHNLFEQNSDNISSWLESDTDIKDKLENIKAFVKSMEVSDTLEVNGQQLGQTDIYKLLIEKGYFDKLSALHGNDSMDIHLLDPILSANIDNMIYISQNILTSEVGFSIFLKHLGKIEDTQKALSYLENISFPIQSPERVLDMLGELLEKIASRKDIKITGKTKTQLEGLIVSLKLENNKNIFDGEIGVRRLETLKLISNETGMLQKADEIISSSNKLQESGGNLDNALSYIDTSTIDEDTKEKLKKALQTTGTFGQEVYNIISKEFGSDIQKKESFIEGLQAAIVKDAEDNLHKIEQESITTDTLDPKLKRLFKEGSENGESILDPKVLQQEYIEFLKSQKLSPNISKEQEMILFLQYLKIEIQNDSKEYILIQKWIESYKKLSIEHAKTEEEIINRGDSGKLDDYHTFLQKEFYNGNIFYTPENDGETSKGSSLPENWEIGDLSPSFQQRLSEDINGGYLLSFGDGQIVSISRDEVTLIQSNPEAEKNLINTYDAMTRSGLGKLWNNRQKIFKAIANVQGLSFDIHNDYIGKNELKILFDSILSSVEEKPLKSSAYTIDEIVAEMERKNGTNITGQESEVNRYGDTRIESAFIQRYMPRGGFYFHQTAFEQSLKI